MLFINFLNLFKKKEETKGYYEVKLVNGKRYLVLKPEVPEVVDSYKKLL